MIFTARICSSPPTAPPLPTATSTRDFIRGRVTLVGCPKLDAVDYAEKLDADLCRPTTSSSMTVARMEVPCCGGLESAVRRALEMSGKDIPLAVSTIAINGELLESGR